MAYQNGNHTHEQKFKSGALNRGPVYEKLIPAYFALKLCLDSKVKSFDFELNPSPTHKFDDFFINVTYKDGATEHFKIQLKHREEANDKVDAKDEFSRTDNTRKGKAFNIKKYIDSYPKHNKNNQKFILFTNVLFSNCDKVSGFQIKKPSKPFKLDLLNVDNIIQFEIVENVKVNCPDFYFIYGQNNVDKIEEEIIKFFKNRFHANETIANAYIDFFEQVRTQHFKDTKLSKDAIILNLLKILVANWSPKSIISKNLDAKTNLFEEAVKEFDLTILTDNNWKIAISGDLKQYTTEAQKLKFSGKKEECTENIPTEFLCFLLDKPLYLKITNDQQVHTIKSILPIIHSLDQHQVKLVLVSKTLNNIFDKWKVFTNLKDLENSEIYTTFSKNLKVSLQGREAKSLKELEKQFNLNFNKYISTDKILNCLNSTLCFGKKLSNIPKIYIPKKFQKLNISLDNLKQIYQKHSTIVHCEGNSREFQQIILEKHLDINTVCTSVNEFKNNKKSALSEPILALTDEKFVEHGDELKESEEFFHLKLSKDNMLEWCEDKISGENPIIFKNNLNILIGDPGTAKTTTMKYLALNCPINYWVVPVSLDETTSVFANHLESDAVNNLLKQTKVCNLDNDIFGYYCKKKQIVFFFDGINRLNKNSMEKALRVIKTLADTGFKIWISCRNNLQNFIESYLGMSLLYYRIDAFTKEEQEEFIRKKFQGTKNNEIVNKIINNNSTKLNEIFKNPTILKFVVENPNILDDLNKFEICKLYALYFEKKLTHIFEKKGIDINTLEKLSIVIDVFQGYYFKGYQIVALELCLENSIFELLNVKPDRKFLEIIKDNDFLGFIKINEDKTFSFEHHSFAEYCAAMWLDENFKKIPESKKQFIFQEEYEDIRFFFDVKLAEGCPLHLAVLNQNLSDVKKFAFMINEKDKGGRTALHLAASLGRKHKILRKTQTKFTSSKSNEQIIQKQEEILNFLLKLECDPLQKDDLFNWNVLEYADASLCLSSVEKLFRKIRRNESLWKHLQIYSSNLHTLTFYCVTLGYESLLEIAIKIKDLGELSKLHEEKPLLHLSLENNQPEIAKILIDNGFNLETVDLQENTALHKAATWGHKEIVKLLLIKKVNIESKNKMGKTALHLAARMGHQDVMEILLNYGANIDSVDIEGKTPLHTAAFLGRSGIVEFLHKNGCNVNCKNKNEKTALHRAAKLGHLETVKLLVKFGVDLEAVDKFKSTALHYAASEGFQKIVEYLVLKQANVFVKNENNKTPKELARGGNYMNIVKILQEAEDNCPHNVVDENVAKNLHEAAEEGDLEFIQKKYNEADITEINKILEEQNENKNTLLHIASCRGHLQLVKFLLSLNVNTSVKNADERIPLHLASYCGHSEIVKGLIPKSNISAIDKWGLTPLHRAACNGKLDVTKLLITAGANINCLSFDDKTPLHSAARGGNLELLKWLLENGADINQKTYTKQTCLHIAVTQRRLELVKYLVKKKKEFINDVDTYGKTALHIAAERGYTDLIDILIADGADVNQKNEYGNTALDAAKDADRKEIVEYLTQLSNLNNNV